MLRKFAWLMLFGVVWQCSDGAYAQLFRRHVRTIPPVYYAPGPWGCVDEWSWGMCPGPVPNVVYSCDGCVIWIWEESDACCQPCQPAGKQVPSATDKAESTSEPSTSVLKPPAEPEVPKTVETPTPPPAAAPPTPSADTPPEPPTEPKTAPPQAAAKPELDIEATLKARGGFEKLLAAAKVARLLEELAAGGPFTVLAPTDEAFAKLDALALERLLANPDKLNDLLLYHAFSGKLTADAASKQGNVKTVQGSTVQFRGAAARLSVNDAEVTEADIVCTNGVLHVIDRVLFPQGFELTAAAANANPQASDAATPSAAEGQPGQPKTP